MTHELAAPLSDVQALSELQGYEPSAGFFSAAAAGALVGATRLVTDARARWVGCEPLDRPRIYFANHTSHIDFLLLWSALPAALRRRTRPVAARDYWQKNVVRRYLADHVFRSVFVDREHPELHSNPLRPLVRALDAGESLILFPEGTRGCGSGLLPFRSGIFHIAGEYPEVELVPAWIENAYRVMPKGSFLPLPVLCSVTFGPPTRLDAKEEKPAFLRRLGQHLLQVKSL